MMLEKINVIIKRAWIVFTGLISLLLLLMMGEHDFAYVKEFVLWALVGTPLVSYIIYRSTRFVFHGR
jgi:hypothetical protein